MMKCPRAGTLYAYLDDELPDTLAGRARAHIASCSRCQQRLAALRDSRRWTAKRLAAGPVPPADLAAARARLGERLGGADTSSRSRRWIMEQRDMRRWGPALAGVTLVTLLVLTFSSAPVRALAHQLLAVFRVERVAGLPFDPGSVSPENARTLEEMLHAAQPEAVVDEAPVPCASIDEASSLAGFAVRLPRALPGTEEVAIEVKGRTEYRVPLQRDMLAFLLQAAGMDSTSLPADFDSGEVTVTFEAGAHLRQGDLEIAEILHPAANYPEGLDARTLAEAGLRFLGLPPQDARRISSSIDWTTTLVLPVPTTAATLREVQVAGVSGLFLEPTEATADPAQYADDPDWSEESLPRPTIVWQKDGILYALAADLSMDELVRIAESMF
ncbi:MAG: DUF4367 domain-containing protein [Chloroflexi bacterium]|nr:DUF4367 domain-containing protein [Chloroflexota bacterium]